jgi:IS5 family transposase
LKLFEPLLLQFEKADWARKPEFALFDTILEQHPELIKIVENDITAGSDARNFGRGDSPRVEQIMRGALYQELEYAQSDSRICEQVVKINPERPYSFQAYQQYISKINAESLEKLRDSEKYNSDTR